MLRRILLITTLAFIMLSCNTYAFALNPGLDISQYAHTAWNVREGFTQGVIFSIEQTPDGYMWLGTEFGLYRFDGVRANLWQPPAGQELPSHFVYKLLVARDGRLWIGTAKGVASLKDGKLTRYPKVDGQMIYALREDREGIIWSGGAGGGAVSPGPATLCAINSSNVHCYGRNGSLGGGWIGSIYEDRKGDLWAASKYGIWRWKPGRPEFHRQPMGPRPLTGLAEEDDGSLLIGTVGGVQRFLNGKTEPYPRPRTVKPFMTRNLLRDHDGGVWIATYDAGLVHAHQGRASIFKEADGLSGDDVFALFEDRENNVWVSTTNGLDRFRDTAVATFSQKEGLSTSTTESVLADRDGSVWVATHGGLDRWRSGQITAYGKLNGRPPYALFQDSERRVWASTRREFGFLGDNRFVSVASAGTGIMHGITRDSDGNLWMADQQAGLFRVRGNMMVERIPWAKLGHDFALSLAADDFRGGLWLGFEDGGISHYAGGHVQERYTVADGLGKGSVGNLQVEKDGTLWAATDNGLSRMKNGHFATLSRQNGLPCSAILWMIKDDDQSFWLYTPCGLIRLARSEIETWAASVDSNQRTLQIVHPTVFDVSDGVRAQEVSSDRPCTPLVAKSMDGRIWFLSWDGVSVINPHRLPFNRVPPPVFVEQVRGDTKSYNATDGLRLPPLTRDLTIDYTALSLTVPQKVRFRYKLEGQDSEWKEVQNEREVRYTNLGPGHFTFRVTASNNDNVWNQTGASLHFSILPAYYQTTWFRLCCLAALLLLLSAAYLFRVRHLEGQFIAVLEARVDERTRIARDLHDTLLQSFNALLLRLQAVSNVLPAQPKEAKRRIDGVIEQASDAITEGRDAVQELRSVTLSTIDLAEAINNFGNELLSSPTREYLPQFHVEVEGTPKILNPIIRDEAYRIAAEALRNAIRHSKAQQIEVEIHYDAEQLRLRIRDDGTGIDQSVLDGNIAPGHWGLRGMRERATLVGGKLEVWSELDSGAEVELSIPGISAYAKARPSRLSTFRRKLTP